MIIVVGTPRSGTTFVVNWVSNENPTHTLMRPDDLGELFQPYFFETDDIRTETIHRISLLSENSIFKLHTGSEMSPLIWDFIKDRPIILVRRCDVLGQFISYGIGEHTNKWVTYNKNDQINIEPFVYEKKLFEDLAARLIELKCRCEKLNISQTIWYEDIPSMKINGKLPQKQNNGTIEDKLKLIINSNQFISWYNEFIKDYNV